MRKCVRSSRHLNCVRPDAYILATISIQPRHLVLSQLVVFGLHSTPPSQRFAYFAVFARRDHYILRPTPRTKHTCSTRDALTRVIKSRHCAEVIHSYGIGGYLQNSLHRRGGIVRAHLCGSILLEWRSSSFDDRVFLRTHVPAHPHVTRTACHISHRTSLAEVRVAMSA